jgi:Cys-tRNA(Pro)/Cys-tRNA(Cys) deacylase
MRTVGAVPGWDEARRVEHREATDLISVSAGQRGLQILIAPDDYIRAVEAQAAPIAKEKE